MRPRPQAVAQAPGDVVLPHDVAQVVEVRVQRILLPVRHHPLGDQRTAAADDARHAAHREVQVLEHHAAVDRHVIDALLGLVLDHVEEMLRPHVLDVAAELLQHLVDRHRADRHRRRLDDRLANAVDVLAGRQVHHRVGAVVHRGVQLLQLAFDVAGDGRVADVGVDLAARRDADAHRLEPAGQMHAVGGNHHAARGDFRPHKLRLQQLAPRHIVHFGGDVAGAGMFQLGDRRGHGRESCIKRA